MESELKKITSLLSGDLNYDNVKQAKQIARQLLKSDVGVVGFQKDGSASSREVFGPEYIKVRNDSFLHVKVGSDDRPAGNQDIIDIEQIFDKLKEKFPGTPIITTHHNVNVHLIEGI